MDTAMMRDVLTRSIKTETEALEPLLAQQAAQSAMLDRLGADIAARQKRLADWTAALASLPAASAS